MVGIGMVAQPEDGARVQHLTQAELYCLRTPLNCLCAQRATLASRPVREPILRRKRNSRQGCVVCVCVCVSLSVPRRLSLDRESNKLCFPAAQKPTSNLQPLWNIP